jgi:hypothetical protein
VHKRIGVGLGLAAFAAAGGIAVAASAPPTGNRQAISFERSVAARYRTVPAVREARRGFAVFFSEIGRRSYFSWQWGAGVVPRGWVHATEHVTAALRRGRVVWAQEVLVPPRCRSGFCTTVPVEIVVTRAGQFWRFDLRGRTFRCFRALGGTTPLPYGSPWVTVSGDFAPLVRRGGTVIVRSTYPWDPGQTATEIDVNSAASRLLESDRVSVSRGGPRKPAFRFTTSFENLARTPAAPRVPLCG